MDKAITRTIAFTLPCDDMPLDISSLFADEKPAGKHGFLQQNGGNHFIFEDGTPARFWGVNFNSAANFLTHEQSEIVAKRLAKVGLNMVRFHQLDGDWYAPNLFQFNKADYIENTRNLCEKSLEKLDYLIYCLKENGIYIYFDNLTYRRFRSGDGVHDNTKLLDGARRVACFNERIIELQKEFCNQFWNHFNPYTQLCYKDDPAIALSEIINESNVFLTQSNLWVIGPYKDEFEQKYLNWRKENNLPELKGTLDITDNSDKELVAFKVETQKKFFEEMKDYLRQLGVKCPLTGTNWKDGGIAIQLAEENMDYVDTHGYAGVPGWGWSPQICRLANASQLHERKSFCDQNVWRHIWGRPLIITEWDNMWPNEYRAETPLRLAALCCLQGWDGALIHTYNYGYFPNVTMIAPDLTSNAIAGVPYRSGIYNSFNDPCRFGLFYHAALMMRRGDLKESNALNFVQIKGARLSDMIPVSREEDELANPEKMAFLPSLAETQRTYFALPGQELPENATLLDPAVATAPDSPKQYRSDTGEYWRDIVNGTYAIDSPRTKIVCGFLAETGTIQLQGLEIRCHNSFATLALSSLTNAPLTESPNTLLTAVGNADNTDAQYNENHTIQYSRGHGPIEAEVIVADLKLSLPEGVYRVDAINPQGMQIGSCPATYENGNLSFSIGGDFASIYYIIQKM